MMPDLPLPNDTTRLLVEDKLVDRMVVGLSIALTVVLVFLVIALP